MQPIFLYLEEYQ